MQALSKKVSHELLFFLISFKNLTQNLLHCFSYLLLPFLFLIFVFFSLSFLLKQEEPLNVFITITGKASITFLFVDHGLHSHLL